jgi:AAA domain
MMDGLGIDDFERVPIEVQEREARTTAPNTLSEHTRLRVWSYHDMLSLPDPTWLVEGVIQERTSALLFGKSNAFKSFLGIDLAGAVASGRNWHGAKVAGPCRAIYVATEGAHGVAKLRIPGWMDAHNIPESLRNNVAVIPDEVMLDRAEWVDALIEVALGMPDRPALVVVDIFGASMSGPETSDETARAWVRSVNRIMREVSCAVLTVAHTGWADETRARMHTHFWGSFDTRLKAEGDKESRTTVLTVDRHKDADSSGRWGFALDVVDTPTGGTTLVPRLSDEVKVASKSNKRRGSQKPNLAFSALSEALADHGKRLTGPHYPTRLVVALSDWRRMCVLHGLTDSDKPDSIEKAFNRSKLRLIEEGKVRQFGGYAWKVHDDS